MVHTLESKNFYLRKDEGGVWRTLTDPSGGGSQPEGLRYGIDYVYPTDANGFTPITQSADTLVIYVSSSEGSDTNDGLSEATPVQSIEAGLALAREGYPDHVLFKRGDVWSDAGFDDYLNKISFLKSGRSASEPAVVSYYGTSGDRPLIEKSGVFYKGEQYYLRFFHLIGIAFNDSSLDLDHPNFTGISHADGNQLRFFDGNEHILVEDCKFSYTELKFQAYDTNQDSSYVDSEYPRDIFIRRNIFTGIYYEEAAFNTTKRPSNIYISGVRGQLLLEENVFDYGGWTDDPRMPNGTSNTRNHNVYLQHSMDEAEIRVRGNIFVRGSHLGIHCRSGGYITDNFFARNSIGMQMGYTAYFLSEGTPAFAHRNVITEGYNVVRGEQNPDGTWTNESYAGSRATWGISTEDVGDAYVSVVDNIVAEIHDTEEYKKLNETIQTWDYDAVLRNVTQEFTGNIAWNWTTDPDYSNPDNYIDPGRKLADYNEHIGGANDIDGFMDVAKNREVGTWDTDYTAIAVNSFVRAGYEVA